jgi:hypothetical protein
MAAGSARRVIVRGASPPCRLHRAQHPDEANAFRVATRWKSTAWYHSSSPELARSAPESEVLD